MKNWIFSLLIVLGSTACVMKPPSESLPKFSYLDSLRTAKTLNCASKNPNHCMACALQGEAANQSAQGIYAVGVTIMTRAKGNIYNVCRVTKARRQFEGMRRGGLLKISRKVMGVTQHIMKSRETGWTHFWAPKTQAKLKRAKPTWASVYEKRQCTHKKIDDHIFYNTNQCRFNRHMHLNAQNN